MLSLLEIGQTLSKELTNKATLSGAHERALIANSLTKPHCMFCGISDYGETTVIPVARWEHCFRKEVDFGVSFRAGELPLSSLCGHLGRHIEFKENGNFLINFAYLILNLSYFWMSEVLVMEIPLRGQALNGTFFFLYSTLWRIAFRGFNSRQAFPFSAFLFKSW